MADTGHIPDFADILNLFLPLKIVSDVFSVGLECSGVVFCFCMSRICGGGRGMPSPALAGTKLGFEGGISSSTGSDQCGHHADHWTLTGLQ